MGAKVSAVVPCYNAIDYIEECLESLAHQTMKDIETIIVDDGSTDGSGEILDLYAKNFENITVVHQPCISQANALNRGLHMATGEYVAECDADDFVSLRMYEKLYAASEGKADAVRCGFYGIYPDGMTQYSYPNVPGEVYKANPKELIGRDLIKVFGQRHLLPAGIYRRQFLLDNEILWREGGQNYEDTSVEFKIRSTATDYRIMNECLYFYRRGNPNSGTATIQDEYAICEQYDEIERWNATHGKPEFMSYMDARRFYDYRWMLGRIPEERRVDFVVKMMADFTDHPAQRQYFNSDDDFRDYCLIKYGAWIETGVRGC